MQKISAYWGALLMTIVPDPERRVETGWPEVKQCIISNL